MFVSPKMIIRKILRCQTNSRQLPFNIGWQDLKDLFRQAGKLRIEHYAQWSNSSSNMHYPLARVGGVIRADVHIGPDGRPKGSGIVVFENPDDARNAIQQFNGYDWQGRMLEVREDRYAGSSGMGFSGRGGYGGGMRGGFGGGFGRGGYGGGRGGFGFSGRGGFSGGGANFDASAATAVAPNPFTDGATAGTEKSETIYVRNVSRQRTMKNQTGIPELTCH